MKLVTIVGARPQFIKAAAVSRAIIKHNKNQTDVINEITVHTGQHYDHNMSEVFFKQLELKKPDYNLGVRGFSHGAMTGRMLEGIESILQLETPDMVLIYGDTNSTLAGALAACKMYIPVAHVEAGLRSYNMRMPEEINRILADRISTLLLCPTEDAVANLKNEGIIDGVYQVGDVMYDVSLYYKEKVLKSFDINIWNIEEKNYILCTVHREENTDNLSRLENIFEALQELRKTVDIVFPIHPRTKKIIEEHQKNHWLDGIIVIPPLSYFEIMRLELSAMAILTDSGGIQKEAFFHQVPCITLRDETEWKETVELGWNQITGANRDKILTAFNHMHKVKKRQCDRPYGDGDTAEKIIDIIQDSL